MTALLLQRLRVKYTQPAGAPWRPQLASKPSRGFSTARCIKTIPHKTRGCAGFQPENKTSKCWSLTSSVNKHTNFFFFRPPYVVCVPRMYDLCVSAGIRNSLRSKNSLRSNNSYSSIGFFLPNLSWFGTFLLILFLSF